MTLFTGFPFLPLLLSHFSHVRLCVTPQRAAHWAPPSLGFSRREHWNGLLFPSVVNESESEVAQSCPTLSDPMDCSLPGFSVHGIFQAGVLEWGAIALSDFFTSIGHNRNENISLTCPFLMYLSLSCLLFPLPLALSPAFLPSSLACI